ARRAAEIAAQRAREAETTAERARAELEATELAFGDVLTNTAPPPPEAQPWELHGGRRNPVVGAPVEANGSEERPARGVAAYLRFRDRSARSGGRNRSDAPQNQRDSGPYRTPRS